MPFKPGQSGNPAGRPPKPLEDAAQSVLTRVFNEKAEEQVVKAQLREAKKGSTAAATWLWDRKYGKVKDVVDTSNDITIRVIRANRPDHNPSDTP